MAIANAMQLEATRATPALSRFDPMILIFDLWPWTFAVYRLWCDETLYQILTQSSNPRRSRLLKLYLRPNLLNTFDGHPLLGGWARWIDKKERKSSPVKLKAFPTNVGRPNKQRLRCDYYYFASFTILLSGIHCLIICGMQLLTSNKSHGTVSV